MQDASKQKQSENPFSADAAQKAGDVAPQSSSADVADANKRESQPSKVEKKSDAAPPAGEAEDASLENMNKELHNLMGM